MDTVANIFAGKEGKKFKLKVKDRNVVAYGGWGLSESWEKNKCEKWFTFVEIYDDPALGRLIKVLEGVLIATSRITDGQVYVIWYSDDAKSNAVEASVHCTCDGPTKVCDTGYSIYKVCAHCKKEKNP